MKALLFRLVLAATAFTAFAILSGCVIPGMGVRDMSIGFNGSYEEVREGLPVNWIISRYPVKNGDAEVSIDTTDSSDGDQSLRIVVHRTPEGVWGKPFIFQVRSMEPGATYAVSFWLKNQGCHIYLIIRNEGKDHLFGLSETEKRDYAAHPPVKKVLDEKDTGTGEWRRFRYVYTAPETDGSIRFELKILQPGTLWIDDVRIEPVEASEEPVQSGMLESNRD